MTHDPERDAAAFLAGDMSRRRRRAFEDHIVDCEDCWREVDLGRRGRALAESGRELSPQLLRERVRAAVETLPPRPRRLHPGLGALALGATVLVFASILAVGQLRQSQPALIQSIVADFHGTQALSSNADPQLPQRLGDLRLVATRSERMEGRRLTVHTYKDAAGHVVAVYQSPASFPEATGADHSADEQTWSAAIDGVELFCTDRPVPSLVVGNDQREVALAADELDIT